MGTTPLEEHPGEAERHPVDMRQNCRGGLESAETNAVGILEGPCRPK